MRHITIFWLLILVLGCSSESYQTQFRSLLDTEWSRLMDNDPIYASSMGDLTNNNKWPDTSINKIYLNHNHELEILRQLEEFNITNFSDDDQVNYFLFKKQYENSIEAYKYKQFLMPFSHRGGIQLEHETTSIVPFRNKQNYLDWIERISQIDVLIDNEIEKARIGIDEGIVPPRFLMQKVYKQIALQVFIEPNNSPFYRIFKDINKNIDSYDEVQEMALNVIKTKVIPAYARLHTFFKEEYLPACRTSVGIKEIKNGKEYYEFLARKFTTTNLTPLEIHEIGLAEVDRIRKEMEAVIEEVNWDGSFKAFLDDLRTNSRFYYDTPEDLFEAYLATSKRIDPELVKLFKVLPSMPYGLKPIPMESAPDTTTAYYQRPAADGSRAGYYFVNLYRPEVRPKYEIEVLSVHEAMPGHHLQIALAMELDLPNFRKYGGITAYVEGWGLYSERLGYDLGLYQDPYSKFGQLTYDMWRAIRLVVDTGMHYFDWSRQDAVNYFLNNSAKTKQDVLNEVDRYINWPGQALAYKIGQLKILELKANAELAFGDKFNIKDFHHEILKRGALPLDTLEKYINEWIADGTN